jgi:hypothetical protein
MLQPAIDFDADMTPDAVLERLAQLGFWTEATQPDGSVLFLGDGTLSDGTPLKSLLFRSAKYGGAKQPFIFFNAGMTGIGGELLGDMGGFSSNACAAVSAPWRSISPTCTTVIRA